MVFKNIFDFARSTSDAGSTAEAGIADYIPKQPNEAISVRPHDPWQPVENRPQDPKLVRETSPQAQSMFNLVSALTSAIRKSADKDESVISDPSSVVGPGTSVMKAAQDVTKKIPGDVPSPSKGS